ncbi:LOW QUALITY PROTEIN: sodium/glucose cotransporter 4-like [Eurytemora carolleeae]|uniref:LOW QUALITY PROTEIN: sodium/glucose cotransporter 4-like n=1 Tax=Eurytemora carolleeae TaxID=1294199 RepID=UPI000C77C37C|nr:LOW QUALITY PROTEIN: sodium/glucose cotransporter 4-like [Eurytemora carolleeae]|eukprot:XP_023340266.1 LOW QUALITY PROTEIN: sodium/glucose cotransporter 4-like [Eurytemora affinis]
MELRDTIVDKSNMETGNMETGNMENGTGDQTLETWDYVVIVVYFSFVLFIGLWSSWRSKRDSVGGYFLASRSMNWVLVGASLFASNIGSGHFIGLAGSGAASGIGIAGFELSAIYYIIFLGWCFVPVYMSSGVYTMPEYLRLRFGGQRIRVYLSVLALLLYVFTKISADLYAGALFIDAAIYISVLGDAAIYISILILLAIACLFTVAGGLTAVIWTDFIQTILMLIGAIILAALAFSHEKIGGYETLIEKYFNATATIRANNSAGELCGGVPEDSMHLLRSATPGESDLPWSGLTFGLAISSIWYWCSDQVIVQRALASKDMSHAKGACILAGYLKLLPLFIMIFPGMAARVLFPDVVGCADPIQCKEICGSEAGCTNMAFIKLVAELMPIGLRGMMLAVMLAALMSSLTSIFNSSSTIFTMDLYPRFRPKAGEAELLVVGRVFVLFLVGVAIVWIPIIQASQGSQLFNYIQAITSYLAPPICAIYLLAIFWPRTNEPGAFWGLMVGLVVGLIRFGLEFGFSNPPCGSSEPPPPEWWQRLVGDIHFLHFGLLLWAISGIVAIVVSLLTPPPHK